MCKLRALSGKSLFKDFSCHDFCAVTKFSGVNHSIGCVNQVIGDHQLAGLVGVLLAIDVIIQVTRELTDPLGISRLNVSSEVRGLRTGTCIQGNSMTVAHHRGQ